MSVPLNTRLLQEPDIEQLAAEQQKQQDLQGGSSGSGGGFEGLPMDSATRHSPADEPSPFLLAKDLALAALVGGTGTGTMQSIYSSAGLGLGLGSAGSSVDLWLPLREVQQQAEQRAQAQPPHEQQAQAEAAQQHVDEAEQLQQQLPDLDLNIDVAKEIQLLEGGFLGAGSFGWVALQVPVVRLAVLIMQPADRCLGCNILTLVPCRRPRYVVKARYKGRQVAVKMLGKMFDGGQGGSRILHRCAGAAAPAAPCVRLPLAPDRMRAAARAGGVKATTALATMASPCLFALPQLPAGDANPRAAAPPQRGGAAGRLPHAAQHLHRRGAHGDKPGSLHLQQVPGGLGLRAADTWPNRRQAQCELVREMAGLGQHPLPTCSFCACCCAGRRRSGTGRCCWWRARWRLPCARCTRASSTET
jgi:hypothetical protein